MPTYVKIKYPTKLQEALVSSIELYAKPGTEAIQICLFYKH